MLTCTYTYKHICRWQAHTDTATHIHRWMKIFRTNINVYSVNVNERHTADRNTDYCICIENLHFPSTGKSVPYRFWYSILPQFQVKFICYLWTATVNSKHGGKLNGKVSGIKLRYNDYFRYAYNMSINMNFYLYSIRQFRHNIMPCTATSKAFRHTLGCQHMFLNNNTAGRRCTQSKCTQLARGVIRCMTATTVKLPLTHG